MCSKTSSSNKPSSVSEPATCASGHILLVSMQKLRNPAFQRFGADLRKTLMITSVVKQARKYYQLGSDVPVNCACVRTESMFVPAVAPADDDAIAQRPCVEKLQPQSARKHSLSSYLRKSRRPKTSCIVPSLDEAALPESFPISHESNHSWSDVRQCNCQQCKTAYKRKVPSAQLRIAISPTVIRYLQYLNSDDTPPIKKRRLAFLPREHKSICLTATVC